MEQTTKCPTCGEFGTQIIDCFEVTGASSSKEGLRLEGTVRSAHYECPNHHSWNHRPNALSVPSAWNMKPFVQPDFEVPEWKPRSSSEMSKEPGRSEP